MKVFTLRPLKTLPSVLVYLHLMCYVSQKLFSDHSQKIRCLIPEKIMIFTRCPPVVCVLLMQKQLRLGVL